MVKTADDISALQTAVNDASSRAAALWLSFLTFMAYLTMTVGAVTHEALLKQTGIKLPILNIELPLVAFFWIAPIFFLLFHFYLFLQLVILVRKVASFDANLQAAVTEEQDQEEYRKRLDSFLVVQFLSGADEERRGVTGQLLRSVAVITLVILPILLLLQFQVTFLPYHDAWVTWVHRVVILVDIRLAWVFWFAIRKGDGEIRAPEIQFVWRGFFRRGTVIQKARDTLAGTVSALKSGFRHHRLGFVSVVLVIFTTLFVFAYKDEPTARIVQIPIPHISNNELIWELEPIADVLLHGPIDMVAGRPRVWFSNVLVVPNKKLVDDKALETDFPSLSLRGRNLSGAVLIGSDLRNADFTGTNLNDARLDRALLTRAKFRCASPYDRRTRPGWPSDECTWLQRASLFEAKLQAADFDRARMHGAVLVGANLMGAQLTGTQLQGAMLINAQLQAALIEGANLDHAFLNGAFLIGAIIKNTQLQGVLLGDTIFQLAYIEHDRNKIRLVKDILQDEQTSEELDNDLAIRRANTKISQQFLHAEIRPNDRLAHDENVRAGFEFESLAKLRQDLIAKLAAENKIQVTDFQMLYERAEETGWESIRKAATSENPPSTIDQYTIDFACNPGSSPFITSALIRDEKIMWVLKKLSKKDVGKALEIISRLQSPECAGAKGLKTADIVALDFMKQKIMSDKPPVNRASSEDSDAPGLPSEKSTQMGVAH